MTPSAQPDNAELIGWLERRNVDFPYYRGQPVPITPAQWIVVLIGVAVGFATLVVCQGLFPSGIAGFIPAILYVAIPLSALAMVAGSHWTALFRQLRRIDIALILAFFLLNAIVTISAGSLAAQFFEVAANPVGDILAASAMSERILFFLKAAIQLLGEEIFTILPFLAFLTWLTVRGGVARTPAIMLAALAVSILFALIHLPTYQWNLGQALVGLIPVRLVLLLPYIITKNIWVSTGVHVVNDWVIFALPLLVGVNPN